ncbi:response regulator [Ginsengibacter hankyongi]|uniref:Response regulator n=1 Tax=Ginsengibacter hankyongi TaxID=2607284 RepID=A0A5J5III2_9BACT|nr:response regulator [Ginsengibacter hankyongi]KAA9040855.1 response regulator [Ginsengibacter hankyongi]
MKKKINILLIEDNEGDVELIKEAFSSDAARLEISVIDNGEDALLSLKSKDRVLPDLILLDINLPKVDGREVLHFVKNDDGLKKIPVVMLTTSSLQKDIEYSYNNYANCYIVKPGNLPDFIRTLKSIERFWLNCVTYLQNS